VGGLTTAVALAQCGFEVGFDRGAAGSVGLHARSDGSCGTRWMVAAGDRISNGRDL